MPPWLGAESTIAVCLDCCGIAAFPVFVYCCLFCIFVGVFVVWLRSVFAHHHALQVFQQIPAWNPEHAAT